jgi:CheY-like chemotaxis protein
MSHTLLLADDSATIQRVVELTFANEDIDVVTVGDGTRAIEVIERDRPDIVLADVSMPGRDGYEVASFVRSDPARDRIPVVLLTGAFEPLDESRCETIGRHEVLVKPFEPRQVIAKVRELLDLPSADVPDAPAAFAGAEALVADSPDAAVTGAAAAETAEAAEADVPEAPAAAVREGVVPEAPAAAVREGVVPEAPAVEVETSAAAVPVEEPAEPAAASAQAVRAEQLAAGTSEPSAASADDVAGGAFEPDAPLAADAPPGAGVRVPPAGAGGSVLAQSFMTFLAVEQGAAPPAVAPADTGAEAGGGGPALQVTDALMDELVNRVAERMTETVLRDTVAEVVARIAERLAREESTRVTSGGE